MTQKNLRLLTAYARRLVRLATDAGGKTWKRGERDRTIRELVGWIQLTIR
jgi:hypothetical protein